MSDQQQVLRADAVFEGGGVKGSAHIGALTVTEERGYQLVNLAGTSAGSIIAALAAAGYAAAEMKAVMDELDYSKVPQKTWEDNLPGVGQVLSLLAHKGLYQGNFVEQWIRDVLRRKGVSTFRDLVREDTADIPAYRYKLQVVASDITRGKMLIFPGDARDYGINPDEMDVALAVRMSSSIPFFFEPVTLKDTTGQTCYIVDGGLLSDFPVGIFDTPNPAWPTFGYKLVDPDEKRSHVINGPISMLEAMVSTALEAHDARYIEDHDFVRTVTISTLGVQATDFDINSEQKQALFDSGVQAARDFFDHWDFQEYVAKYRDQTPPPRRGRLMPRKPNGSTGSRNEDPTSRGTTG